MKCPRPSKQLLLKLGVFLLLLSGGAIVNVAGCASLPQDQRPSSPASIPTEEFKSKALAQLTHHQAAQYRISIAHAAIPDERYGGLFVYLLITANPPSERLRSIAQRVGIVFSHSDNPTRHIEVIGPAGDPIALIPMKTSSPGYIFTPPIHDPAPLPSASVIPDQAVLQVCLWQLHSPAVPGTYRMRLVPPRNDNGREDWIWNYAGGIEVDTQWLELTPQLQPVQE